MHVTEIEFVLVRVIGCSTLLIVTVVVLRDSDIIAGKSEGTAHDVVHAGIVVSSASPMTTCVVATAQLIVFKELEQSLTYTEVSLVSQVTAGITALTTGTKIVSSLIVTMEIVVDSTKEPSIVTGRAHEVVTTTAVIVPTAASELPYVHVAYLVSPSQSVTTVVVEQVIIGLLTLVTMYCENSSP